MIIMKNKIIKILNQKLNIRSDGYCFITIPRYLNKKYKMITEGNFDIWMMPSNVEGSILKQITKLTSFRVGLESLLESNLHCLKEYNTIKERNSKLNLDLRHILWKRINNQIERSNFKDHSQLDFKNQEITYHPYFFISLESLNELQNWLKSIKGYKCNLSSSSGYFPTNTIKIVFTPINKKINAFTKSLDEFKRSKKMNPAKMNEKSRNYILKTLKEDFEQAKNYDGIKIDGIEYNGTEFYIRIEKYKDCIHIYSFRPIRYYYKDQNLKYEKQIIFDTSKNWNIYEKKILSALKYLEKRPNTDLLFHGNIPPMYQDRFYEISDKTNCPYCNEDITLKIYSEKEFKTTSECPICKKKIKLGLFPNQIVCVKINEDVPLQVLIWGFLK